jgi:hypothetical protein
VVEIDSGFPLLPRLIVAAIFATVEALARTAAIRRATSRRTFVALRAILPIETRPLVSIKSWTRRFTTTAFTARRKRTFFAKFAIAKARTAWTRIFAWRVVTAAWLEGARRTIVARA